MQRTLDRIRPRPAPPQLAARQAIPLPQLSTHVMLRKKDVSEALCAGLAASCADLAPVPISQGRWRRPAAGAEGHMPLIAKLLARQQVIEGVIHDGHLALALNGDADRPEIQVAFREVAAFLDRHLAAPEGKSR